MSILIEMVRGIAIWILTKLPDWMMEWGIGILLDRLVQGRLAAPLPDGVELYPSACGDQGIDLAQQRLSVSIAFGTYFAGLLERKHSYLALKSQVECCVVKGQEALDPIQRIFWALQYPKGPRVLIIAAEGGMGKSTLAAKIVRCLFEEQAIDMILGDSAKTQRIDPATGEIVQLAPSYYDMTTFYEKMCGQLGLPASANKGVTAAIRDRLEGRRAVIVADNLETVKKGDRLLDSLGAITTRDIRAIVTTREVIGLRRLTLTSIVVNLNPLTDVMEVKEFLRWHILHHQDEHPRLLALEQDLKKTKRIQWLIERTGGIPLLIQLVFSDVARFSWDYLERLPSLFGGELLAFLYRSRWNELSGAGKRGLTAKELLKWVASEQYRGKKVTSRRLGQWAQARGSSESLEDALKLLYERFLILNHDRKQGSFAVFPSLAEFLQHQH